MVPWRARLQSVVGLAVTMLSPRMIAGSTGVYRPRSHDRDGEAQRPRRPQIYRH